MTLGARKNHDFCWINLMTPDGERARAFFAALFGWTSGEMPGVPGGHVILVDGKAAGAFMDTSHPETHCPKGSPPMIGPMVKVESADALVERARALGGRAEPAFDVMRNGRMAMITDPSGAMLGVWQPYSKPGFEHDRRAHGAPSWFETITPDVPTAARFYAELFGWTFEEQTPMAGMSYTIFKLDGEPIAGAMAPIPKAGEVPPHWNTTFTVEDAEAAVRIAVERGGTLAIPVGELAGVGKFALLRSPQGVHLHICQWAR